METLCPTCGLASSDKVTGIYDDGSGNQRIETQYDCGHIIKSAAVQGMFGTSISLERLKVKNARGEQEIESKFRNNAEIRYTWKSGKMFQFVWHNGKLVHLDCKADNCGNEWKIESGTGWEGNFDVKISDGKYEVVCRGCNRTYYSA